MKHLRLFVENFAVVSEQQVEEWLSQNCNSEWFDSELNNRVHDYISTEEAEDYDDDVIEAYKNLSTGGAVEYDLLSEMNQMVCDALSIPKQYANDEKIEKRTVSDICHDHLMDNCKWYDKFVFNRKSTEPYKSYFNRAFGTNWDSPDQDGDIKFII